PTSSGLLGLRDRVEAIGGTMRSHEPAGRGNVVVRHLAAGLAATRNPRVLRDLAGEVAGEPLDELLELAVLLGLPAAEELCETGSSDGDESFIACSARRRERDRPLVLGGH